MIQIKNVKSTAICSASRVSIFLCVLKGWGISGIEFLLYVQTNIVTIYNCLFSMMNLRMIEVKGGKKNSAPAVTRRKYIGRMIVR